VLIYFTTELQRRALQLFAFALRDGGLLALGKAETTSPLAEFFAVENSTLKLYRRQGERVLIPPGRMTEGPLAPLRPPAGNVPPRLDLPEFRGRAEAIRTRPGGERAEMLVMALPVGVAVVDRRYDIQSINNAARRLLGNHTAAVGENLVQVADGLP